ncbi:MAG: hypothetical protein ABS46_01790 [Cytophagaceae bacterium SCN 52-12]|nr:MAG: hypothetical protein ABS46_01790 [Cytophagaceae bacterium SCN 52-12]
MTRGEFEKLAERYRLGECTPEEVAFVEQWVRVNGFADGEDRMVFENEAEAAKTEEEVWSGIRHAAGLSTKKPRWLTGRVLWPGAAAGVILVVAGLFLTDRFPQADPEPELAGLETFNTSTSHQRIILPDSSVVTLAEGASIATSESYGQHTRTVRLKGEAFFEIRPDPKVPFLVYSGDLVTEVLGTSFTVRPEAKTKTIEVSVATGKVSVYSNEKDRNQRRRGVIITPNQKAVYDMESKTIRQDLVDDPRIVVEPPVASVFKFDETPVRDVLSILRQTYQMEIVVNNSALNDCLFTGNVNGFDLFKQLAYICDAIDARYEVRGTSIFLTGEGCGAHP